ncbi:MAG: hypothetical protein HQ525_11190 [Anaerolineae bacterium]|nr:hypothetical protein [Anaerolineae bacterium]
MDTEEKTDPNKKKDSGVMGGLVLIAIGVIFLVMQYSNIYFNNWWALFILIPVFGAWSRAVNIFRESGEITEESIQVVMGSLFPLFVAAIFLFNLDWGRVWPGFIIIAGLNALARGWGQQSD